MLADKLNGLTLTYIKILKYRRHIFKSATFFSHNFLKNKFYNLKYDYII